MVKIFIYLFLINSGFILYRAALFYFRLFFQDWPRYCKIKLLYLFIYNQINSFRNSEEKTWSFLFIYYISQYNHVLTHFYFLCIFLFHLDNNDFISYFFVHLYKSPHGFPSFLAFIVGFFLLNFWHITTFIENYINLSYNLQVYGLDAL